MNRWNTLIKQDRYSSLRRFYLKKFEPKLALYRTEDSFTFDFKDKFWNTPLHLAAQHGNALCVQTLIEEYRLNIDLRNKQGWMPKDLLQDAQVKKAFSNFYARLDREI